ncbi:F0F1 ATP synthase subunit epsilon [Fontimonas sp. SYSU GA230001]|uniref:F0F1 ATP synthase subunit epsilon n=1 Tax=Fontimonas sp. SYSU GA230001 TaxID=3142450 RepID=UPI0032B43FFC
MTGFALQLCSATRCERIDGLTHFIGEDASGQFGLLPHHAHFITALGYGLARFRTGTADWQYLALPGAVLRFHGAVLNITTRRYLLGSDPGRIREALDDEQRAEDERLGTLRSHLTRLEREMARRLSRLSRP